jgi:hypothetical protein
MFGWASLFVALMFLPSPAMAWSDDVFDSYLQAGQWSTSADDNASGEALPFPLVEIIVRRYCEAPTDSDASDNMGIFALTVGAANWGISEAAGLPADPNRRQWRSTTGADAGKHVMAYAIGGVGISHGDVGDLYRFLLRIAEREGLPQLQRVGLHKLAREVKYRGHTINSAVVYDEVRAAGVCKNPKFDSDLNGEAFTHRPQTANASYCAVRSNSAIGPEDWHLFRTAVREALRRKQDQEWLLRFWLDKYWKVSLDRVRKGPGSIEEVIVNSRIRNSSPAVAARAIAPVGSSPDDRIAHELNAYGAWKPDTLKRRKGTMLRPVVLYRHMAERLRNVGVMCP